MNLKKKKRDNSNCTKNTFLKSIEHENNSWKLLKIPEILEDFTKILIFMRHVTKGKNDI